jgi:hypothetical protein
MTRRLATICLMSVASVTLSAHGQTKPKAPTLSETLEWLSGATNEESADGFSHHTFESSGKNGCDVVITETRGLAGPNFWIKESFSLGDIDPVDIRVQKLGTSSWEKAAGINQNSAVSFHATNYREKIFGTSNSDTEWTHQQFPRGVPLRNYIFFTSDEFAPRFAKAFKNAAVLCGGKPSSF